MSDAALLKAISQDRALGSSILFSHRHSNVSPDFHVEMLALWQCADEFVLIEAFREAAKSTLAEEFLAMEGCFGNFRYCVLWGETYAKACQRLEAIAFEATRNAKLKSLFGKVLARKPIENKIWFESGAFLEAVGWEQEVTGFKYLDARPDRGYLDDVENLERVRDTEAVDASMRKLYREILPAMDKKLRRIRITNTPRAPDCMITRLRSNPEWVCRQFPICNGDIDDPRTVSAWPDRYPMEWIRKERDRYHIAGELRGFMQEFMLSVDSAMSKPFREEMLRSLDIAPAAWLPRYAIYDPARTSIEGQSDRTGKVVVSRMGSKIIVHESTGEYWQPDEIRADAFRCYEKHHLAALGIEKNALDDFLLQPMRSEMLRRGLSLPLRALQAPQDRDKNDFIMGLQPFFAAGDVMLVGGRGAHPQLVAELLNFPAGKLDTLNALAYAPRMFGGQLVYEDFGNDNVAPAPAPGRGETVYCAWNASPTEIVCACVMRQGRHLIVAADFSRMGALIDGGRQILAELAPAFPGAVYNHYAPANLHDNWNRIPLVSALKELKLRPWRSDSTLTARGALAERIRTRVRDRLLLTVDAKAKWTLNALAGEYKYPILPGNRQALEPQEGTARLIAEAVETLTAIFDKGILDAEPQGAHYATNAQGTRYQTSLPRR